MASEFIFKVTEAERNDPGFSTSGITLDADLCKNYSQTAIKRAKELKAKHKDKYSDEYYLNYAKSLELQDNIATHREIYKNLASGYEIQDSAWAGYSYEEIIEMENNGYKIPDEVLQWAHAQQQSDVTAYVMIREESTAEDGTSTEEITGDSTIAGLETKTKKYITQSEEAYTKAEEKFAQYQETVNKAVKIKREKEDSFQKSMKEISDMTEEWKDLNEKKENGTLSFIEKMKYDRLSKILNSTDSGVMKELELNSTELDSFLSSMETLNTDVNKNLQLAQETIQAGKDLSNYSKNYYQEQTPNITQGVVYSGSGLLSDALYGEKGDNIANIAIEKGNDLNEFSGVISAEISSDAAADLVQFANTYTTLAAQTIENSKQTEENNPDNNQNDNSQENTENTKQNSNYSVNTQFSFSNAAAATAITTKAASELSSQQSKTNEAHKRLKKDLTSAQKEIQELNKEISKAEEKDKANLQQGENFLAEPETLQIQNSVNDTAILTAATSPDTITGAAAPTENQTEQTSASLTSVSTENSSKIQAKLEEMQQLDKTDKQNSAGVSKNIAKNLKANTIYKKDAQTLTNENTDLTSRAKNLAKAASDTQNVGIGTVAMSYITTAIGQVMFTNGLAMMTNPFTYATGLTLSTAGKGLLYKGLMENISGAAATIAASAGINKSSEASSNAQDADSTLKDYNSTTKQNEQIIKEVQNQAGQQEETNNLPTDKNGQTMTAETNEQPQTQDSQTITETSSTNAANENSNETIDQNKNQTNSDYSFSTEFGTPNAIKASNTVIQTTQALNNNQASVENDNTTVITQAKKSVSLIKNIDKEASQAKTQQQTIQQQAQSLTAEYTSAQNDLQTANTQEAATSAQAQAQDIALQYDTTVSEENQASNVINKTLANSMQEFVKYKTTSQTLNKNIASLNRLITNQRDISEKTLVVGIGTTALGGLHTAQGSSQITFGTALMTSPFTFHAGVIQTVLGNIKLASGVSEVASGTLAAATATAGLITNTSSRSVSSDTQTTVQDANTQYKEGDKKIQDATKDLGDNSQSLANEQVEPNTQTGEKSQEEIQDNELETVLEDDTIIAASASTNANINNTTSTDDKEDRKLSRFNMDSIIESKKKKKKVTAILAASGNKA